MCAVSYTHLDVYKRQLVDMHVIFDFTSGYVCDIILIYYNTVYLSASKPSELLIGWTDAARETEVMVLALIVIFCSLLKQRSLESWV